MPTNKPLNSFSLKNLLSRLSVLDSTETTALNEITAGTIAASKAVVVDSNKDASAFRNLNAVNIDAGASGTAGSVDVFPATASKGKTAITAADNTGNTTTTINTAAQAAARTYTVPDAGAIAGAFPLLAYSTIAAAGANQATGTGIISTLTVVTAADGNTGVVLPTSSANAMYAVYSSAATVGLKVYPATDGAFNDGTANAAITIEGKTLAIFIGTSATNWACLYTADS